MALNINSVSLAGNLTRNPELRVVGPDKTVVHFSLAINRRYKGADGELKEEVTFVDCEAWGRTAELIGQYLLKGSGCFIEGRLRLDSWTDKEGKNRSRLKVLADNVQFLNRPREGGGEAGAGDGGEAGMDGPESESRPAQRPYASGAARAHSPGMQRGPAPARPNRAPAGATAAALGDEPPF